MNCPRCDSTAQVLETRLRPDGLKRRRYVCANKHRFSTIEQLAEPDLKVNGQPLKAVASA